MRAIWMILLLALTADTAFAGMQHLDCRAPMVFSGAAVNVVVLPYRYAGGAKELTDTGKRLSLLVKLDNLIHILPYGSVGSVQMEPPPGLEDDPSCRPDVIWSRLLGQASGGVNQVASGHGLVLIWGLLYEEGDDIFVRTYARFARRGTAEELRLKAGDFQFSARLSSQAVSFAPRRLTKEDLEQVTTTFREVDYIRKEPKDTAPGEQLAHPMMKCFGPDCPDPALNTAYWVDKQEGEWMHLVLQNPNAGMAQGWVHAGGGLGGKPLHEFLPELHFVRGVAGYLRERSGLDKGASTAPKGTSELAISELQKFLRDSSTEATDSRGVEDEMTVVVSRQLIGVLQTLNQEPSAAIEQFSQSMSLAPNNAEATTLTVIGQISEDWKQGKATAAASAKANQLISAVIQDPNDDFHLENLRAFYNLLLQSGNSSDLPKVEVEERLKKIEKLAR